MFVIDAQVGRDDRAKILAAYQDLQSSLSKYKRGSEDYRRIARSLAALGRPGQANGVTVTVGNVTHADAGAQIRVTEIGRSTKINPTGLQQTITFNRDALPKASQTEAALTLVHEGTHAADQISFTAGEIAKGVRRVDFSKLDDYRTEFEAYMTEGATAQVLAPNDATFRWGNIPVPGSNLVMPFTSTQLHLWNPSWANLDAAKIHSIRGTSTNALLVTPRDQGGYGKQPRK